LALAAVPAELGASGHVGLVDALRAVAEAVAAAEAAVPGAGRRIALALSRHATPELMAVDTPVRPVVPGTPLGTLMLRRWLRTMDFK
jgi:hypothetical protein